MKIFVAGASVIFTPRRANLRKYIEMDFPRMWVLMSYLESKNERDIQAFETFSGKVFLDSGAFSAFTRDEVISLDHYIKRIYEVRSHLCGYANLDVIGDAKATWKNQVEMERQGLNPMPCYHWGEDADYLKRYMDRHDYLALGGIALMRDAARRSWLDEVWGKYLVDTEGAPRVKVHGFGVTSLPIMERYPWYSVDSTSWFTGRHSFGTILYIDAEGKGRSIDIDCETEREKKMGGRHFLTLSRRAQEEVIRYVEDLGVPWEVASTDYVAREAVNVKFYLRLMENGFGVGTRFKGATQPSIEEWM